MKIFKMKKGGFAARVALASALALAAGSFAMAQPEFPYNELELYRVGNDWEYRISNPEGETIRLLSPAEIQIVSDFLAALPADDAGRRDALCVPLLNALKQAGAPARGHPWFGPSLSSCEPSAQGMTMLAAVVLGSAQASDGSKPDGKRAADVKQSSQQVGARAVSNFDGRGQWEPMGMLSVDQAGVVGRGYGIPVEGAQVGRPGDNQVAVHAVASNFLYDRTAGDYHVAKRFETHTAAVNFRRGFGIAHLPRFELGAQVQVDESDAGFLNGFIKVFEHLMGAPNPLRNGAPPPPSGYLVEKKGQVLYRQPGGGSGLGDVSLLAKAVLKEGKPFTKAAQIAGRITLNLAGKSQFSNGNFLGAGLSIDKKISELIALHGDMRETMVLDSTSKEGLALKRWTAGASAAVELRVSRNNSFSIQVDANSSPNKPTGFPDFDKGYGDITLGWSHRCETAAKQFVIQLYGRENMNLPFAVRNNLDPDFAVGVKLTILPKRKP